MQEPSQSAVDWHVLGPGALGALWACMLSESGARVTLVGRSAREPALALECASELLQDSDAADAAPAAAIPARRFTVAYRSGETLRAERAAIHRLLVCTKAHDAVAALASVESLLADGALVITLCNGLGFHEQYLERLRARSETARTDLEYFAAVTSDGAMLEHDTRVIHTGIGITRIGRYESETAAHCDVAKPAALQQSIGMPPGLKLKCCEDANIRAAILQKAMVNCAINPLTALYRCRNGALLDDAKRAAHFASLCEELQLVYDTMLQSSAVASDPAARAFDLRTTAADIAAATAANQSSMLRDVLAGRRSELDALNSHVLRIAESLGLHCPVNRRLIIALSENDSA